MPGNERKQIYVFLGGVYFSLYKIKSKQKVINFNKETQVVSIECGFSFNQRNPLTLPLLTTQQFDLFEYIFIFI